MIQSICEAIIADIEPRQQSSSKQAKHAALFLQAILKKTQWIYRMGLTILLYVFWVFVYVHTGKSLNSLTSKQRLLYITKWTKSRIQLLRQFARFFLTLTLLHYYDSDTALEMLHLDRARHRAIQGFYTGATSPTL